MRRRGIARAAAFTWARCAEQTLGVYERLLSAGIERAPHVGLGNRPSGNWLASTSTRARCSDRQASNRYCEGLIPQLAAQAPFHELIVVRLEHAPGGPYATAANVRDARVRGVTGTLPLLLSRRTLGRVFASTVRLTSCTHSFTSCRSASNCPRRTAADRRHAARPDLGRLRTAGRAERS